jgi:excisionase family DNA binding protein
MIQTKEKHYTIAETKKILRLSSQTIQKMLRRGELLGFQSGNKWVIFESSIEAYIEKHSNKPQESND